MNKQQRFVQLGPGAALLILTIVVLSMSTLGLLMLFSSKNDRALSDRALYVAQTTAEMNEQAEEHFASVLDRLAAGQPLPDRFEQEDNIVFWEEKAGQWVLECAVDTENGVWVTHRLTMESESFL